MELATELSALAEADAKLAVDALALTVEGSLARASAKTVGSAGGERHQLRGGVSGRLTRRVPVKSHRTAIMLQFGKDRSFGNRGPGRVTEGPLKALNETTNCSNCPLEVSNKGHHVAPGCNGTNKQICARHAAACLMHFPIKTGGGKHQLRLNLDQSCARASTKEHDGEKWYEPKLIQR